MKELRRDRGRMNRDTWRSRLFRHCPMRAAFPPINAERDAQLDNLPTTPSCGATNEKQEEASSSNKASTKEACSAGEDMNSCETQCVSTPQGNNDLMADEKCNAINDGEGTIMQHSWLPQFLQEASKPPIRQHGEVGGNVGEESQHFIKALDMRELRVLHISNNNSNNIQEDSRSKDSG